MTGGPHVRRLLLFWFLLLLLGTWHPFTLRWTPVVVPSATFFVPRLKGLDPPLNLLLFLPLGWGLRQLGLKLRSTLVLGMVCSGVAELGQHWVAFRVPVFEDLLFNTAGAGLGWWRASDLARLFSPWARGKRRAVLVIAAASIILGSAGPPVVTPHLWLWDEAAKIGVGAERTGNYRWPGRMVGGRLNVDARTVWTQDQGEGTFSEAARAVLAANRFVLSSTLTWAPMVPADDVARIWVWSSGVQRRNVLVGQDGADLVVRISTRVTPLMGRHPDGREVLRISNVPPGTYPLELRYTGEGAQVRLGEFGAATDFGLYPHNGVRRFLLPPNRLGHTLYLFGAALVLAAALGRYGFRVAVGGAVLGAGVAEFWQGILFLAFSPLLLSAALLGALLGAWATAEGGEGQR